MQARRNVNLAERALNEAIAAEGAARTALNAAPRAKAAAQAKVDALIAVATTVAEGLMEW